MALNESSPILNSNNDSIMEKSQWILWLGSEWFSQGGNLWCDLFLIHYPLVGPTSLVHSRSGIDIISCR